MLLLSLELLLTTLLRFLLSWLLSLLLLLLPNLLLLLLLWESGALLDAFSGVLFQTLFVPLLPAQLPRSIGNITFIFLTRFHNSRHCAGFCIGSFNACFLNSRSRGLGCCGPAG